jgi:hypothetical protein
MTSQLAENASLRVNADCAGERTETTRLEQACVAASGRGQHTHPGVARVSFVVRTLAYSHKRISNLDPRQQAEAETEAETLGEN